MQQDIIFIPLGGGQRVGASCYYLKVGDANIILDAGIGIDDGLEFGPDFHFLIRTPFIQSMAQINNIFISHAHMDHVGYLLKLMKETVHANVYMTEITRVLSEYQLYDRLFIGKEQDENIRLAARSLLEQIATVSFMQTIDFGRYKATFYPAGHIPGAMMILFETGKKRILYTGDYSLNHTALTQGCMIPKDIKIDTVIICGLHAKHPDYIKKADAMYKQAGFVLHYVGGGHQSLMCQIPQLSKGIEFIKKLNDWNKSGIPIYIDQSIMNMVIKMEKLSVPVLNKYNRVMGDEKPLMPHIYLTSDKNTKWIGKYRSIKVDFSLHEDFNEMKQFLKKINPRQAIVVHCGKENSVFDDTIEQEMMKDVDCRTQFTFADEEEVYRL
ncbi:MBL fold metallo-hydrolase [Lachnoanaerobaculum saburreum]|uniref:Metallo-beta-lactamase domain protein n=1 Tax=Lachnoanaerobaculum saburreum DSM 3986 TaxID=887325 RepID=E6LLS5_9FIRM|nr:MBL fold metallo-hydrolase [Lachnoanaerobaculum saburreum]EFU77191.1 metallo-beta-lactamase domain protein [Lachnoanaerobaculum saburreum DSM 3986]